MSLPAFNLHPDAEPPNSAERSGAAPSRTRWRRLQLWLGIPAFLIILAIFCLNQMFPKHTVKADVRTVDGEIVSVIYQNREHFYWYIGHSIGISVYSGHTRVAVRTRGKKLRFGIPDDFSLFAVNLSEGRCFLIFKDESARGGGFRVYSAPLERDKSIAEPAGKIKLFEEPVPIEGGVFAPINIMALPTRIAYRNFLENEHPKESALSEEFLSSERFSKTDTAELWSDVEDGAGPLNQAAVERFKQKFLAARQGKPR